MTITTNLYIIDSFGKAWNNYKEKEADGLKIIGIILIIFGVLAILMGSMMYGDIGIAAIIGATTALLSGIGFLLTSKRLSRMEK
ncbi:hypothetical protein [Saccharibacillus kuerlensis]|uniref:Uncharacterized protein n=1 Tax=Saccharibacillus kuerlensis TaxID=459527 RepID=A0ABQ2L8A7_9BACL|nr:hypothetical protein [Saccharibacillus kuerlensis]GGO06603.1 hypothetical protein GCM10010969_34300 [Saccharibacillus kuerlensis]